MSSIDAVLEAQTQSGTSIEEDSEEIVRIPVGEDAELMEAVFELENGKAMGAHGEVC